MPLKGMVRNLVIANVAIWLILQVIVEQFFLSSPFVTHYMALVPGWVIERFFAWQPVTYMFVHSLSPLHILSNMLLLWWLGGELESHWGSRFFTSFYFASGIGAAVIYIIGVAIYSLVTGRIGGLDIPVVGASGAIFGLMMAYGIVFGERTVLFFFVFPMKARWLVIIMGAMEVVLVLNHGVAGSGVANLAHLGGLIAGFLFLWIVTRYRRYKSRRDTKARGRKLTLVVDNNKSRGSHDPKYWN
jgi:membrane associated rhomboid family serine protease